MDRAEFDFGIANFSVKTKRHSQSISKTAVLVLRGSKLSDG